MICGSIIQVKQLLTCGTPTNLAAERSSACRRYTRFMTGQCLEYHARFSGGWLPTHAVHNRGQSAPACHSASMRGHNSCGVILSCCCYCCCCSRACRRSLLFHVLLCAACCSATWQCLLLLLHCCCCCPDAAADAAAAYVEAAEQALQLLGLFLSAGRPATLQELHCFG